MRSLVLVLLLAAAACGAPPGTPARAASVDTVLPRDEALARFRHGLPAVSRLEGGAPSPETLVARFVAAVRARDTAELNALLLTRAEFAWLFYPESPQSRPPYDLPPDLMWNLLRAQSEDGLRHTLRLGAGRMTYLSHTCSDSLAEGPNRLLGCMLRVTLGPDTLTTRLTGPILHRDGRFKFVSYTSALD